MDLRQNVLETTENTGRYRTVMVGNVCSSRISSSRHTFYSDKFGRKNVWQDGRVWFRNE